MGIWKDQLDMMKAATSPEMRQLVGRANAMERPSMLDGIRQANALMEQTAEQQRLLMLGATPIAPSQSPAERLERLAGVRDRGILTETEFAAQKARILAEL